MLHMHMSWRLRCLPPPAGGRVRALHSTRADASAPLSPNPDKNPAPAPPPPPHGRPCSDPRDELPDGRTIYRCVLSYKLAVAEGGKFTPKLPVTNG